MRSLFFSQPIKRIGTPYNFIWDVKTLTERLAKPNHEACFEQIKSINNLVLRTNGRPLFILPGDIDYLSKKSARSLIEHYCPKLSHLKDDFFFLESVQHCLERNEYTFSNSDQKELFLSYYSRKVDRFSDTDQREFFSCHYSRMDPDVKHLGDYGVNRIVLTPILRKMGYPEPELDWAKSSHNRINFLQLTHMEGNMILCADPAHRVFFYKFRHWRCWEMSEKNVCSIENAESILAEKYDQVKEELRQEIRFNTIGSNF